jgi:4-hydroxy-tetrahydrodipicolinate synthase
MPDGSNISVQDRFRNPLAIKVLMSALGMPSGPGRQPLGKMTHAGVDIVRRAVTEVWERNPEILAPIGDFYGVDVEERIKTDDTWVRLASL